MNVDFIYLVILILCFIFSVIGTIYQYNKNKYKLVSLYEKLTNGWGLYKVKLEKYNNESLLSPSSNEECLYYYAKLNYEEKVITPVNKKKIDVKFYKQNKERVFHNNLYINVLDKRILINSKDIELSLDSTIKENIDIPMKENEKIINLEEKYLKENIEYFCLLNIQQNKIDEKSIKLSNNVDDFKKSFYFETFLIWMPTVLFCLTYTLLV